jgi:hypothetical protein
MPLTPEEITRRYTYHPPDDPAIRALHDEFRGHERWMAQAINDLPEDSREKSLAFTALEEMSFWIHAHIARNLHVKKEPAQ